MGSTPKWEYFTTFLWARAARHQAYLAEGWTWPGGRIPPYAPEALIPELDGYGDEGWELVHIEPVKVGERNNDVMVHNHNSREWTNAYFCVFKRPRAEKA